jgi:GDP-L-fucose synthase
MDTAETDGRERWGRRSTVYVAGHKGLVGSALVRALAEQGHSRPITAERVEVDLTNQSDVNGFFEQTRPEYVVLAAGHCISAEEESRCPVDAIHDNLSIQCHVVDAAYSFGSTRLLLLAPQRAVSTALGRAVDPPPRRFELAKAAGVALCAAYRRQFQFAAHVIAVPPLYGADDRFSLNRPDSVAGYIVSIREALVRRAPAVRLPGDPDGVIEPLHADDLARALLLLLEDEAREEISYLRPVRAMTLRTLAHAIATAAGYPGAIEFNDATSFPDPPSDEPTSAYLRRRRWRAQVEPVRGLRDTFRWFNRNPQRVRL